MDDHGAYGGTRMGDLNGPLLLRLFAPTQSFSQIDLTGVCVQDRLTVLHFSTLCSIVLSLP